MASAFEDEQHIVGTGSVKIRWKFKLEAWQNTKASLLVYLGGTYMHVLVCFRVCMGICVGVGEIQTSDKIWHTDTSTIGGTAKCERTKYFTLGNRRHLGAPNLDGVCEWGTCTVRGPVVTPK